MHQLFRYKKNIFDGKENLKLLQSHFNTKTYQGCNFKLKEKLKKNLNYLTINFIRVNLFIICICC